MFPLDRSEVYVCAGGSPSLTSSKKVRRRRGEEEKPGGAEWRPTHQCDRCEDDGQAIHRTTQTMR
jgi:hypothetical protein